MRLSREPGDLPARVAHHLRGARWRADHRSGDGSVSSWGRAGDVCQGAIEVSNGLAGRGATSAPAALRCLVSLAP